MASLVNERPTFSATTPHFFKIILDNTSRDAKLRIPKKFVKKYGEHLSNPIHLKLPSSSEWKVEVTTCDGEVWFDKGWPKFSEFYSLHYGDFLVFRYERNSVFHVCIFDTSATEIDYPITSPEMEETDEEDDVESVDILEDFPRCLKIRDKSPLPCPLPRKKMRMSTSTEQNVGRMHSLTEKEKAIALERAIGFKSEKPHCKVAIQPSYLLQMNFPSEFAKQHLIKPHAVDAILKVSDRGTWPVKFKYALRRARLLQGWAAFARDNDLKVGDVCVLILIKGIKLSFEVVFYRATEAANCPSSPVENLENAICNVESDCAMNCDTGTSSSVNPSPASKEKECPDPQGKGKVETRSLNSSLKALEAASNFVSKNQFFRVTLGLRSAYRVRVPVSFSEHFIEKKKHIVMLWVKNRRWPVNLNAYSRKAFELSAGWGAFAKENGLKEGDICIFELIDRNDFLLKVHMFRC